MTTLRTYGDPCGIARALDLVGERWSLLIVRELVFGPKRFTDLRHGLPGASPNVLSQRLRELEAGGIVRRRNVGGRTYELTDSGRDLHPILVQLGRWGARSSAPPLGPLSTDALMVALESSFDATKAAGVRATYEIRFGEERFSVEVSDGSILIYRGMPRRSDAVISTDPATLRAVVFGDQTLSDAAVEIAGNKKVGRTFFRIFTRPT